MKDPCKGWRGYQPAGEGFLKKQRLIFRKGLFQDRKIKALNPDPACMFGGGAKGDGENQVRSRLSCIFGGGAVVGGGIAEGAVFPVRLRGGGRLFGGFKDILWLKGRARVCREKPFRSCLALMVQGWGEDLTGKTFRELFCPYGSGVE